MSNIIDYIRDKMYYIDELTSIISLLKYFLIPIIGSTLLLDGFFSLIGSDFDTENYISFCFSFYLTYFALGLFLYRYEKDIKTVMKPFHRFILIIAILLNLALWYNSLIKSIIKFIF